jgi:Uma2 family endonuclease
MIGDMNPASTPAPALALWQQILRDPWFRDVPYKVETTKSGSILMSPASNWHGSAQSQVVVCLSKGRKGGEIINECSILTSDGVKVADVAWASDAFMAQHGYHTPYIAAPEICVEVVSPGNTAEEIQRKVDLYLSRGAHEVWVVQQDASVSFHGTTGPMPRSAYVKKVIIRKRG